ncbi:MAG TPA: family 16 glycoside hydrolase [Thermomicrobiaceae bacterium]|nr:family 16 glycoside hydrolase [Thermomicrobiaceae bacterium]
MDDNLRWHRASVVLAIGLVLALLPLVAVAPAARADTALASPHFQGTWAYTDQPVAAGQASRTWMWGPSPDSPALVEPYWDSSSGWRLVQYFDKTRMEITHPEGDQSSIWYVTNGLLVKELITGNMQLGDNTFEQYPPALVNVAGDLNDPNGPTYATFNGLMGNAPIPSGWVLTQTVDRAGTVGTDPSLSSDNVTAQDVGAPTKHTVASVFWAFMTSTGLVEQNGQTSTGQLFQNPFYATGYPLTEAYWTNVLVGGVSRQVLVQVFERRVLTYTPSNPSGWQVESGNVGLQYEQWRYQQLQQTPETQTALASIPAPTHQCHPFSYTESRWSANQFYGQQVTLVYQGNSCYVFHPEYGVWWDTIIGSAQIYHGSQASGTAFDTRPFTDLSIFTDPADYWGWPADDASCSLQSYYKRWTVGGVLESVIRDDNGNWHSGGQVLTNPVKPYDFPYACQQPPCTVYAGAGVPGDLHIYFHARLAPNAIPGDPQGQLAYTFVVFGADLSTVNLSQVIQGPPGSTAVYHGGNCVFLYLSSSTPPGPKSVTIHLPDGRQSSANFYYVPAIGAPPTTGAVLAQPDLTQWYVENTASITSFAAGGTYHVQTHGYYATAWRPTAASFGDASVSLDVRMDTAGGNGFACLTTRENDPFRNNQIDFCLLASGETVINHQVQGAQETILPRAQRTGPNPMTDWNTLTIVSRADVHWFYVNGTLIGSAQHGTYGSGKVGLWVQGNGDGTTEWEFRNLVVKSVQ